MKILFTISFLISTILSFAQRENHHYKRRTFTKSEIRKSYPYNKTSFIKLVSFKYDHPVTIEYDSGYVQIPIPEPEIPKTNGRIDFTKMFEIKTVDNKVAEDIFKILMNYELSERTEAITFCYKPRNGIIFFDENEVILGYIEICFECARLKVNPSIVTITHLYEDEFKSLQAIFKKAGITYGTKRSE